MNWQPVQWGIVHRQGSTHWKVMPNEGAVGPGGGGTTYLQRTGNRARQRKRQEQLGTQVAGGKRLLILGNGRGQIVRLYLYEFVT
jgi:hypothetical protein